MKASREVTINVYNDDGMLVAKAYNGKVTLYAPGSPVKSNLFAIEDLAEIVQMLQEMSSEDDDDKEDESVLGRTQRAVESGRAATIPQLASVLDCSYQAAYNAYRRAVEAGCIAARKHRSVDHQGTFISLHPVANDDPPHYEQNAETASWLQRAHRN
ncbi:MAG: hypothetical protein R3330_13220 [Saprospiraceae bacterium]|nr:hypothetical protein [Saprospiraceae bacterium]